MHSSDDGRPERRRSRPATALIAGAAAAIVAALMISIVAMSDTSRPSATEALLTFAAVQREQPASPGQGSIRHLRFVDLTDPDAPTYDLFLASDGSVVHEGSGGPVLEDAPSNLSTAEVASLPTDVDGARAWLRRKAADRGLGYPDERPERAVYRLATELLADPSAASAQKAAALEVLAEFDDDAVRSTDLGTTADLRGRPGRLIELCFDEGFVDHMIVDPASGALLSTITYDRNGDVFGGRVYLEQDMTDRTR